MKRTISILILTLFMCSTFALTIFAAANTVEISGKFEAAKPIIRTSYDDYRNDKGEYEIHTFDSYDHVHYFTFTTDEGGEFSIGGHGNLFKTYGIGSCYTTAIFDSSFNEVEKKNGRVWELEENSTYYIAVSFFNDENSFNRHSSAHDCGFGILLVDETAREDGWAIEFGSWQSLIVIAIPIVFIIIIFFPYKKYMLGKYEFNPVGLPFKITMGLMALNASFGFLLTELGVGVERFGEMWNLLPWFFAILIIPGFIAMTIKLISKTRNLVIIIMNTILMGAFYFLMAYVTLTLVWVIITIVLIMIILGAGGLAMTMKSGGGGRKCSVCGKTLTGSSGCNCGGSRSSF